MKTVFALLTLAMTISAVAETIPASARNIRISHVTVGPIATESVEVPCSMPDSDLTCYKPIKFKDVVTVTVDYTSSAMAENEFFEVRFDKSEFSEEEIKALSIRSAQKRVKAANQIFAIETKIEHHTSTNTYCPYEIPYTCREDEYVTDTYENDVKVVNVLKK